MPGKSESRVKPRLNSTFGVPASNPHSSVVPVVLVHVDVDPNMGIDPLDSL